MVRKIALVGAHGTGKTTLVNFITERLKERGIYVENTPEVPRKLCDLAKDPSFLRRGKNSILKQALILQAQVQVEIQKMSQPWTELLICDRAILDHWAYFAYLFGNTLKKENLFTLYEYFVSEYSRTYDKLFYIPIEFPPQDDGIRESDEVFQHCIDMTIIQILSKFCIPHVTIRGTVQERYRQIIEELSFLTDEKSLRNKFFLSLRNLDTRQSIFCQMGARGRQGGLGNPKVTAVAGSNCKLS